MLHSRDIALRKLSFQNQGCQPQGCIVPRGIPTEKFIQSLYSSRHPIQELTSLDPELSGLAYKNSISTARTARLERTDIRTDARLLSDAPDIGAIYCPFRDIFCLSIVEKLSRL